MSEKEFAQVTAQVQKYREITAQIEELTKERDGLKDQMIATMDAYRLEEFTGENFTIRYKPIERTTFDSKTFAKVHPALFAEFAKTTIYTRFSIS